MRIYYIALLFFVSLLACQPQNKEVKVIGFLDAFEDATISQARDGFLDALSKRGWSEKNKTLKVIYRNAQGDIPTLVQSTDYLISQEVALIAACPTGSMIAALQRTSKVPVCMMVGPDPSLVGLRDDQGNAPKNLFGTYDNLDYIATSVGMVRELRPKAKKLGVIYNQGEPQSQNAYKVIAKKTKELGLELVALPVSNSSDTQLVVESLLNEGIDAFFAMPDNVVFSSFEVIFKACQQANVPIFTSEEGLVERGSLAAYGADMYMWGYQAGEQAATYLENPQKGLPKLALTQFHKKIYNPEIAKQFKVKIDSTFKKIGESQVKAKTNNQDSSNNPFNSFYLAALMLGLGYAAMGLGIFISMRIFDIPDITTDGSYTLGGALTAILLLNAVPLPVIAVAVLGAGVLAGVATGLIHTKLNINALLAGILVMTALYSINLEMMGKSNLPLIHVSNLLYIFEDSLGAVFSPLLMLSVLIGLIWLVLGYLLRTDFGLAMRATGNSETMIRANGVNTDRMKIIGLGLANALTALSGFLIVQYQGFADINMGIGIVIIGLGSVMIGETLSNWLGFRSIQSRLLGVIFGTIAFRLILAMSLALGVSPNLLKLVTAALVLVVVALPNIRGGKK